MNSGGRQKALNLTLVAYIINRFNIVLPPPVLVGGSNSRVCVAEVPLLVQGIQYVAYHIYSEHRYNNSVNQENKGLKGSRARSLSKEGSTNFHRQRPFKCRPSLNAFIVVQNGIH
jgi:hypothetical protein